MFYPSREHWKFAKIQAKIRDFPNETLKFHPWIIKTPVDRCSGPQKSWPLLPCTSYAGIMTFVTHCTWESWGLFFKATLQVFTLHSTLYSAKLAETVFFARLFCADTLQISNTKTKIRAQSENLGVKTCRVALKKQALGPPGRKTDLFSELHYDKGYRLFTPLKKGWGSITPQKLKRGQKWPLQLFCNLMSGRSFLFLWSTNLYFRLKFSI